MSLRRTAALLAASAAILAVTAAATPAQKAGKTIIVKMIDKSATEYAFEPANIVATAGDVIRFEQTGAMPHNVEFRGSPAGADLGASKTSPMMTTPGQVFEVAIGKGFTKGAYPFVCVPHEAMGMKGTLTVK